MRGFVAEAAVPRFVSKQGTVNGFRRWDILDKMINLDDEKATYDLLSSSENRSVFKPLAGFRKSLLDYVDTEQCAEYGDLGIDRVLAGYKTCSFSISERDFANNNYEPIVLYADTPRQMYQFFETCVSSGST